MENTTCRTCLKEFDIQEATRIYDIASILHAFSTISIEPDDGLPTDMCQICVDLAVTSYNFKQLCENSDRILRSREYSVEKSSAPSIDQTACENRVLLEDVTSKEITDSECREEYDAIENNITNCKTTSVVNTKEKKFFCRFCNVPFLYKKRLKLHEKKHENGIKCYICDKEYSTVKQLGNHINIHNRKGAHLCQTCGKQFTMPENLLRHERIHTGYRPYKCELCSKSFTQSGELKSHMITHTTEKSHLCSFCGNTFARKVSLQIHIRRLHKTSNQIHLCSLCSKTFKDRRDLSQHKLIHSGERKYICKVCNKAFNRMSNLRVHERIHSGLKPYSCYICHKGFIQKHVLTTHLKTHPNALN